MSLVFYYAPRSSAVPVASALAELDVPHEKITVDLAREDQRRPEFLALNPNGKVPTLVVDGTPMFEAVAIQQVLGDRYGVKQGLWPALDDPARLTAVSWATWAYVTLGGAVGRLMQVAGPHTPPELQHAALADQARAQLDGLLNLLEARLSKQPFMLGNSFSLLDLIVGSVVLWILTIQVSIEGKPALGRWIEQLRARPSIAKEWS